MPQNMSFVSIILFTVSSSLLFIFWKFQNRQKNELLYSDNTKMLLDVPRGPISLPFVGNLIQLGDRAYEKMFKWANIYGPIYKVKLGSQTVVVLNGTNTIREALIDNSEEFAGRPQLYMIHATLKGKGLISSPYNEDFNEHKKFLVNKFNQFGRRRSSLEINCLQTIRETLDQYRERIDHNFEYTNSQMKHSLTEIASQNVLTMTFGTPMNDRKNFSTLLDLIGENFKNTAVAAAFNFLPISRVLKGFILKNVLRCSEFLNNLISEKVQEFADSNETDDDFELKANKTDEGSNIIECYLKELLNNSCFYSNATSELENINSTSVSSMYNMRSRRLVERRRSSITSDSSTLLNSRSRSSRYKSFSFDHLSSIVQDLFIAGTETITVALNWSVIYAAYYPEYQKKVCDEIDRVLGREKAPTESERFKFPYIEAFLNETLRFHCAGPILIPRSTTRDVEFKGYHIPEGTFVMVNMWSCMRDPNYWDNPDVFDPERFLDSNGNLKAKNPAMLPFSIGKRACIDEKDFNNQKILDGIPGIGLNPPNVSLKLKLR